MILALKTADSTTQLWLVRDAAPAEPTKQWESGRRLSDELLGTILETLDKGGIGLPDITGIIIFSGPGSFTSLRIGHTVVNALADSLNIPVIGSLGEHWLRDGLDALTHAHPGVPALPHYGSEAHITPPAGGPKA